jgi:hypothetical protein
MARKPEKITLSHDFAFTTDGDLNAQIAAFTAAHEATNHQILAMDAKRPLGPNKARITFRVVPKKTKGR